MLTNIGLVVIVCGWVYQIIKTSKKKREMSPVFVGCYIAGVSLLVIDGIQKQLMALAVFNSLTILAALGTWWRMR